MVGIVSFVQKSTLVWLLGKQATHACGSSVMMPQLIVCVLCGILTHHFMISGLVWGFITWLLHSPYLAPIDFFLWGHLKLTGTLFGKILWSVYAQGTVFRIFSYSCVSSRGTQMFLMNSQQKNPCRLCKNNRFCQLFLHSQKVFKYCFLHRYDHPSELQGRICGLFSESVEYVQRNCCCTVTLDFVSRNASTQSALHGLDIIL